ncbi:MAG: phosphoenolpyruvate--protein phosphotransferase [Phycisphaeraceae bacterium]
MQIKRGIQVSPGVAIGRAVVLDAEDLPIPRRPIPPAMIGQQQARLHKALQESCQAIEQLRDQTASRLGEELAKIFDFHLGMLKDPHLVAQFEQAIERKRVTAEYAVFSVLRRLAQTYQQLDDRYIRERARDIDDLEHRLLGHLIGPVREELGHLKHEAVLVAHDLTPSLTAGLDKTKIKAIASDLGGRTSHTAILAHALGIPAIVGLEDLSSLVTAGDTVIIDGHRGLVVVEPDAAKLLEYRQELKKMAALEGALGELAHLPAVTKDGTPITIQANIEFPSEIHAAIEKGAVGIGLYRTEFLFLATGTEPTEKQQQAAYKEALAALDGRLLTIRTLDLGADKLLPDKSVDHLESNPFLGCRSIRLCLQNLDLFKTQLRAILTASIDGPVRIMFPLISNVMELRQAKMILGDVMEDLAEQGIAYRQDIPIGIMVEVPSAALQATVLAKEVDFFSIGTNDLIQYTVAVDRGNERIASLYSAAHPAVVQLVKEVIRAGQRHKIDVSLCGEMASQPDFTMLLLGLGLRSFSITPPAIPEIKKIIRSVSIEQCRRVARKANAFDSDREVINYLRDEMAKVIPEVFDGRSIAL